MKRPGSKKEKKASSYKREAFFFLLKFFVAMSVLLLLELLNPVYQKIILPFTRVLSRASVFLLGLMGTDATASGTLVVSARFTADIKAGCTGVEPVIILLSAILAFPSSLKAKAYGVLLGVLVLQSVNLVRIVSLVYLGINHPKYFHEAHTLIWQVVIIALSLFLWMIWAGSLKSYELKAS